MASYRRKLTLTKYDFVVHPRSRREFYFLLGKVKQAKSIWRKHAKRLGYEDARS